MLSFDVKALYTSLPIERTVKIVRTKLEGDESLSESTPLSVDEVLKLLELCLKSTYFSFRKKFFHLKDGVAMGSPVSSIVANIFMEDFEERVMADAAQIRPKVWNRFVDDVFSIIRRNSVEQFLQHLNKQDKNIVFTVEVEKRTGVYSSWM